MTQTTSHMHSEAFPKPPPLPFISNPKRFRSAQSSTVCGTPTPHSGSPMPSTPWGWGAHVQVPTLVIPVDRSCPIPSDDSPRIQRSAIAGPEKVVATGLAKVPTPACRRLYEFRYPPMPKFNSVYKQAKKAEYDGDYEGAMQLYLQAIEEKDRPDSAVKDYAGLLHMRGMTKEAIDFLEARGEALNSTLGYKNLLAQLRAFLASSDTEKKDLPRLVYVSIDEEVETRVDFASMSSLFPNHLKIAKLIFINPLLDDRGAPRSSRALIEFASHSAARKALMVSKHSAIKCLWAPDGLMQELDSRIVRVEANDVCLVGMGPVVKVSYAIVPNDIIVLDWPKCLLGRGSQPSSPPHSGASTRSSITAGATVGPLRLPVLKRLTTDVHSDAPRTRSIELDLLTIEGPSGRSSQQIDWCLNTPSPVRHIACLL